jgi:hypothetical protein
MPNKGMLRAHMRVGMVTAGVGPFKPCNNTSKHGLHDGPAS